MKKLNNTERKYTGKLCIHCNNPIPWHPDMSVKANIAKKYCTRKCLFAANTKRYKEETLKKQINIDMQLLFITGNVNTKQGKESLAAVLAKQKVGSYF